MLAEADADALLSVVNSGSSQVSYEDFVKFVFPPPKDWEFHTHEVNLLREH